MPQICNYKSVVAERAHASLLQANLTADSSVASLQSLEDHSYDPWIYEGTQLLHLAAYDNHGRCVCYLGLQMVQVIVM